MHPARPDTKIRTRSQAGPSRGRGRGPGRARASAAGYSGGAGSGSGRGSSGRGRRGGGSGRGGGGYGRGGGGRYGGGYGAGEDGYGEPRRRRRRVPAWLKVSIAICSGLLLVATASAAGLVLYGRSNIEQTTIDGISPSKGRTVTLEDGGSIEILNVLLVGTDHPGDLTEQQRSRVAPDERTSRRPDTLMVAQLEVGGQGAALMSIPRDLRVRLCDGRVDKINSSFAVASRAGTDPESCLVQTVTNYTGIEIDHYVEVDFAGFLRVVEALGGVTMYLDRPMVDRKAHLDVPAGCVTLTPEQALGFVRSRGYDDDYGRMARQQRFLREVVEEARRVGVLANPARLFAVVDRASRAVRTDDGLGLSQMRDLALGLRNFTSSSLVTHVVPSEPATIDGVAYVIAHDDEAETLFASFRDGSVLGPVASGEPLPPPATEAVEASDLVPADVAPIVVLNASGTSGLAGRTAEALEAAGFRVAHIGNADAQQPRTEVVHGTGLEGQGQVVATALGEVGLRHLGGGPPLTLLLGEDLDLATLEGLLDEALAHQVAGGGEANGEGDTDAAAADGDATAEGAASEPVEGAGPQTAAQPAEISTPEAQRPSFRAAERPDDVDC